MVTAAEVRAAIPENTRFTFRFAFDRRTNMPKMNIYDKNSGEFLIALVFDLEDLPGLTIWAKKLLENV